LCWVSKVDVPKEGVTSNVTKEELDANLDPKNRK
jgi:hypothetical protein